MSLKTEVDQVFLAAVASGNIRYHALPLAVVPVPDDTDWHQLYDAAGSPAVDHWLCGFQFSILTVEVIVEVVMFIDVGYGGVDGPLLAPANVLLTAWPIGLVGNVAAVGPCMHQNQMLPIPIRIPADQADPGSRMAAQIAVELPAAGYNISAFRVILATAVGS